MDKWEFFEDAGGSWRWRCTSADGHTVFDSTRSHSSREHAVADARAHGYPEGAPAVDIEETFVNLKALRPDE
jgi:uncharacterized protein YegP (UPF0339 family)